MKNLLIILAFLAVSCKQTSLQEFKQYNADAPNKVASHIDNFKRFKSIDYGQQDNSDVVVTIGYLSTEYKEYIAYGIFKPTGKLIYFESGQ